MRRSILAIILSILPAIACLAFFQYLIQKTGEIVFLILLGLVMILSAKILFICLNRLIVLFKAEIEPIEKRYLKTFFALTFFFSYLILVGGTVYFRTVTLPVNIQKITHLSSHLESTYALQVSHIGAKLSSENIEFTAPDINSPDVKKLGRVYRILSVELGKYPQSFFNRIGLKNIYLGKELLFRGEKSGGYANGWKGHIILDIDIKNDYYFMESVHHEIFHVIHAYLEKQGSKLFTEWKKLNPKDFSYLGTFKDFKEACRHDPMMNAPKKGFISTYSMTHEKEDLSEVFESLVSSKWHRGQLAHKLKGDPVLHSKVNFMGNLLKRELGLRILVKDDISLVKEDLYRQHKGKFSIPDL